jgi:hypothetical protein
VDVVQDWASGLIRSLRRFSLGVEADPLTAWFAMGVDREIDVQPEAFRKTVPNGHSWEFTRPRQNVRSVAVSFRARESLAT